ncbi:Diphosphomevalonate decarboxylase [Aphelenchoides fujianensis]|nr:Diphosphomevalonate decarboxylase [Aphelenchoides fujianensis]
MSVENPPTERSIVVRAPVNIALIKYWGKWDEELMIPANDSISVNIDALFAETRLSLVDEGGDAAVVNGERVDLEKSRRFGRVFRKFREEAFDRPDGPPFVQLDSRTNFPTAAGLASSAAGFAAVAFGLAALGGLSEDQTVRLARAGSGSACRSVLPGFVHWISGGRPTPAADRVECDQRTECRTLPDPSDLCSRLRAVIFVLSGQQKDVPSTSGMQRTLETSALMERRIAVEVPERVVQLKEAIAAGDFGGVAAVTMTDSDHLHAVCADTRPPLHYLNEDSRRLIAFVREFNGTDGPPKAAYSFDAGPNCCCFLEESYVPEFLDAFAAHFRFAPPDAAAVRAGVWRPTGGDLQLQTVVISTVGGAPQVIECS